MNDVQSKDTGQRHAEARMLTTLCAQANSARRMTLSVRMAEGARDPGPTPRRLVAAN